MRAFRVCPYLICTLGLGILFYTDIVCQRQITLNEKTTDKVIKQWSHSPSATSLRAAASNKRTLFTNTTFRRLDLLLLDGRPFLVFRNCSFSSYVKIYADFEIQWSIHDMSGIFMELKVKLMNVIQVHLSIT